MATPKKFLINKNHILIATIFTLTLINVACTNPIEKAIENNLNERFSNVEIISITPDSCYNMRELGLLALDLQMSTSHAKVEIAKIRLKYSEKQINLDVAVKQMQIEADKISELTSKWPEIFFSKSEKCLLVKYRYSGSDGIKIKDDDLYSLDLEKYKEGNRPYIDKSYTSDYALQFLREIIDAQNKIFDRYLF